MRRTSDAEMLVVLMAKTADKSGKAQAKLINKQVQIDSTYSTARFVALSQMAFEDFSCATTSSFTVRQVAAQV